MLSVFLKVVLFVPSPNYGCPASSACCSYHYGSPTSLACCEFVIACKACKVLYYTWPFVMAQIELVLCDLVALI